MVTATMSWAEKTMMRKRWTLEPGSCGQPVIEPRYYLPPQSGRQQRTVAVKWAQVQTLVCL